jgi:cobalt/nickel transport system permease protein
MNVRVRGLFLVGFVITVLIAGVASGYASDAPDGLEKTAADHGVPAAERPEPPHDSPLTDYRMPGVDNPRLATGLAGAAGAAITLLVGGGAFLLVRRARRAPR